MADTDFFTFELFPLKLTNKKIFLLVTSIFRSPFTDSRRMADKVMRLGNSAVKAAMPHIKTFWYYGKVELAPPKISEIPLIIKGFQNIIKSFKSGSWKQLTVKEAVVNTMVAIEVYCWFFVGECIGKRRIIGYKVTPAGAH